jgi:hypothetical protein
MAKTIKRTLDKKTFKIGQEVVGINKTAQLL